MLPYFPKLEEISISRRSQSKQVEEESNSEEPVSDASLAIHDPRLEKQELDELVWVDPLELNTTKYKGEKTVTPDGQIIWSFLKLNMEIKYCLQPKPRVKKNNSSTLAKLHLHVSVYNPSIVSIHGPFSRTVSSTNLAAIRIKGVGAVTL
ncbi:uncharacterized protein LOC109948470 isoform X2 [Prunus persica]|uniref:uncharacterized protein LOC109948470 isoform X2 n=1 Tax=Prunus persica TaxID=3760 RepID=UPI0009AB38E5|nr:uncharacterized protein LOC109948470 isoform X2 [Prunus persica]